LKKIVAITGQINYIITMKNAETMKDLKTFINELKTFNWDFKNGCNEANRYGFDMIRKFQYAATFSPAHQEVWAEYEKNMH